MKSKLLFILLISLILGADVNVKAQSKFGTGQDSINCITNISLYREFYRQWKDSKYKNEKEADRTTSFILVVSDNGVGIPENLDIKNVDSLGIQLITTLADQLDGKFELKRNNGTETKSLHWSVHRLIAPSPGRGNCPH